METKPALSLDQLASINARIQVGSPRERVLSEAGISEQTWEQAEAAWLARMAAEAAQKNRALHREYTERLRAHRQVALRERLEAAKKPAKDAAPVPPRPRLSPIATQPATPLPAPPPPAHAMHEPLPAAPVPPPKAPPAAAVVHSQDVHRPLPPPPATDDSEDAVAQTFFLSDPASAEKGPALPFTSAAQPPSNAAAAATRAVPPNTLNGLPFQPPRNDEREDDGAYTGTLVGRLDQLVVSKNPLPFQPLAGREGAIPPRPLPPPDPQRARASEDEPFGSTLGLNFTPAAAENPLPFHSPAASAADRRVPQAARTENAPPIPPPRDDDDDDGDMAVTFIMPDKADLAKSAARTSQPHIVAAKAPSPAVAPELDLTQYASLCAELALFPGDAPAIFERYGLGEPTRRAAVDGSFQERLRSDSRAYETWKEYYRHYRAYWTAKGSGSRR